MFRIVVDPNAYVSAVITPSGSCAQVIDAARGGRITLLASDHLIDELTEVLYRDKFRRWLTEDEVDTFIDAVTILAEWVDDRPPAELPLICRDPDDNYLFALAQDGDASFIISGDPDVKDVKYPNIYIYAPRAALDVISFRHKWGEGFIPGEPEGIELQIDAEGSRPLLNVFAAFMEAIESASDEERAFMLPFVAVPSAVQPFLDQLDEARTLLKGRSLGTRPIYESPEVAYLKLPPDSGVVIVSTTAFVLPSDTIYVTLQRCEDLMDVPGVEFDHWRVYGIGQWPIDQIPPRPPLS